MGPETEILTAREQTVGEDASTSSDLSLERSLSSSSSSSSSAVAGGGAGGFDATGWARCLPLSFEEDVFLDWLLIMAIVQTPAQESWRSELSSLR
jgi:hypothetical protein